MFVMDEDGRPTIKCNEVTALLLMGFLLEWEDGDSGDFERLRVCEGYMVEADDSESRCLISRDFLNWLSNAEADGREFTLSYHPVGIVSHRTIEAILEIIEDSETTED